MAKLNPPLPFEWAVACTDCVGMKTEAPRQVSRAGQALPRREVIAEDPKNNLRHELFADGNFAAAGKPELHDGLSYRRSLRANHGGHRVTRGRAQGIPLCSPVPAVVKSLLRTNVVLFLLLTLHVFRNFGEGLAVVL